MKQVYSTHSICTLIIIFVLTVSLSKEVSAKEYTPPEPVRLTEYTLPEPVHLTESIPPEPVSLTEHTPSEPVHLTESIPAETLPAKKNTTLNAVEYFFRQYEKKTYRQFGYDIFKRKFTNQPILVGPDYILGPNDVVHINIWGEALNELVSFSKTENEKNYLDYKLTVNENGSIIFPEIGVVSVNGITLKKLEQIVSKKYKNYCKNCTVNISIKKPRVLQTLVTGKVKNPGYVQLVSGSSFYDILQAAGGITKQGSLRYIQLKRSAGSVEIIDLYDFIITGKRDMFPKIMFNDSIHVPQIGSVVLIKGQVNQPAIFELKENEILKDIIHFVGGTLPDSEKKHIEITRFEENGRKIISVDKMDEKILLKNGDTVNFLRQDTQVKESVYLKGNISVPKSFSWRKGLYLKNIINDIGIFKPETSLEYAEIRRYDESSLEPATIIFQPKNIIGDGNTDSIDAMIPLQPFDEIIIFSKNELQKESMVSISGAVQKPGKFRFVEKMTLLNLMSQAGGTLWMASDRGRVVRYKYKDGKWIASAIEFSLSDVFRRKSNDIFLQPLDRVVISQQSDFLQTEWQVQIKGEVYYPGNYPIGTQTRLSKVFEQAGLLTDNADLSGLILLRTDAKNIQTKHQKTAVDLLQKDLVKIAAQVKRNYLSEEERLENKQSIAIIKKYLSHLESKKIGGRVLLNENDLKTFNSFKGSPSDVVLKNGDVVTIPAKKSFISIVGEVFSPASYLYQEEGIVSQYLNQAGGIAPHADIESSFIIGSNGSVISYTQKRNKFIDITMKPGDVLVIPSKVLKISK